MTILLETNRLIIKAPKESDLSDLYELQSDSDVMEFIGKGIRTLDETIHGLDLAIKHYEKHGFSLGSVYEKTTGKFVGRAGLIYLAFNDKQSDVEIGYALEKSSWQKGFATELSKALIVWAFTNLKLPKVVGIVRPKNSKSIRVLEKIGMKFIGNEKYNGIRVRRYEIESDINR